MQNPEFMTMAERLGNALMQDPAMSGMLESFTNPSNKDLLEERMAQIKDDPSLKPILDEISTGGPAAMMRYWNDKEVLLKLGESMGFAVGGESATAAGHTAENETDEVNEEESIVHHPASVGDVELRNWSSFHREVMISQLRDLRKRICSWSLPTLCCSSSIHFVDSTTDKFRTSTSFNSSVGISPMPLGISLKLLHS